MCIFTNTTIWLQLGKVEMKICKRDIKLHRSLVYTNEYLGGFLIARKLTATEIRARKGNILRKKRMIEFKCWVAGTLFSIVNFAQKSDVFGCLLPWAGSFEYWTQQTGTDLLNSVQQLATSDPCVLVTCNTPMATQCRDMYRFCSYVAKTRFENLVKTIELVARSMYCSMVYHNYHM